LEATIFEQCPWATPPPEELRLVPLSGDTQIIPLPRVQGSHAGGDGLMRDAIFLLNKNSDPLNRMAGSWAGAMSILTGVAANKSIEVGQTVKNNNDRSDAGSPIHFSKRPMAVQNQRR
jgi:hypothetical protein